MEQTSNERATELRELLERAIAVIGSEVATDRTPVPAVRTLAEAKQMAESGRCLDCGQPIPASEQVRRGLDQGCYMRMNRGIERGEVTEAEMIAAGLMLPKERGGRPKAAARLKSAYEQYLLDRARQRGTDIADSAPLSPSEDSQ